MAASICISCHMLANCEPFQMAAHAGASRDNDNSGIKRYAMAAVTDNQVQDASQQMNKDVRGFANDDSGRHICPIAYDWEDLE